MDLRDVYVPLKTTRVHILLKHIWNIVQYRSHARSQNKSYKCKKMEIIPDIFSNFSGVKQDISTIRKMRKLINT